MNHEESKIYYEHCTQNRTCNSCIHDLSKDDICRNCIDGNYYMSMPFEEFKIHNLLVE